MILKMLNLLILFVFIIRWVNTTEVFQSRITTLKYPEKNLPTTYCQSSVQDCVCNNCQLCLFAKLTLRYHPETISFHLLAKTQFNLTPSDEFSPAIIQTIAYQSENSNQITIEVNKCVSGNETIKLDMFLSTLLHSRFFIKCNYCLGYFGQYRLGGILLLNENSIRRTKLLAVTIIYIEFMHQKLSYNPCCESSLQNYFDECSVCIYFINLIVNGNIQMNLTSEPLNSFKIQNKLNYRFFFNLTEYDTEKLTLLLNFTQYTSKYHTIYRSEIIMFDTRGYYEHKYFGIAESLNLKVNYSYSMNLIEFTGRNGNFFPQINPPIGTTYNPKAIPICADPTLFYPDCDNFNNDISYCNKFRPCKNNGTCFGTLSAYKCKCKDGFDGKNCEIFHCSRPCVNSKCVNGNLCGPCDPGYGGKGCEEKVCQGYNKCLNGNCTFDNNKERNCECKSNYYGKFCQYNCYLPCIHGKCKFANGLPFCLCNVGWNGVLCDSDSDWVGKYFKTSKIFLILIVITPIIVFGLIILICFLMTKVIRVNVKKQYDEIHNQIIKLWKTTLNTNNLNQSIHNIQLIQLSRPCQINNLEINKNRSVLEKSDNRSYSLNYPVYEDLSFSYLTDEEIKLNNFNNNYINKGLDKNLINSQELNSSANSKNTDQRK